MWSSVTANAGQVTSSVILTRDDQKNNLTGAKRITEIISECKNDEL
jgi:hypothetical protein